MGLIKGINKMGASLIPGMCNALEKNHKLSRCLDDDVFLEMHSKAFF